MEIFLRSSGYWVGDGDGNPHGPFDTEEQASEFILEMMPAITVDPEGDCGSDMVMSEDSTGAWIRVGELIVYLYRPKANAIERGHDGTGVAPLGIEVYTSRRGIEAQKQVAMLVIRDSDVEETEAELAAEYGDA